METTQMAKQMTQFQKTFVENSFTALDIAQDQTQRMVTSFMGTLPWVTDDAKKQIDETFSYSKKIRGDFKKVIDDGYSSFEKFFK